MPMPTPISGRPWPTHRSLSRAIERCIASAARSARSGSSLCAIGAPQSTMIASPMNLSSVPPCSKMTSTISVKYSLRSWAMPSGPIASAIGVKPRMSLKSTAVGALADGALLLGDVGRHVGREVALEVGPDGGLAPDLLGVARVLDADGGEPAERHEKLQVFVRERVRGREVVHVEQTQYPVG